ncbi:hypothetical protein THRCLA_05664, partial [Thraustotheca clavata]
MVVNNSTEEARKASLATQFELRQANYEFIRVVEGNGPALHNCRRLLQTPPDQRTLEDVHLIQVFFATSKIGKHSNHLDPHKEFEFYKALELQAINEPNTYVFKEGHVGDKFYVVLTGKVEVRKNVKYSDPPREKVVCELKPGDCFGDRALVAEGEETHPREASVVTVSDVVELVFIGKETYTSIVREKTKDMYVNGNAKDVALEVAKRFRSNRDIVRAIFMQPAEERTERDLKFAVEYLKGVKFFARFSFEVRKLLCKALRFVCAWTNTTVFLEGQPGHHFYIIFSGSVDIMIASTNRHNEKAPTVVSKLKEGETFGELALSEENGVRRATVVSADYTELLTLSRSEYIPLIQKYQNQSHSEYVRLLKSNPHFNGPEWDQSTIEAMCSVMVEKFCPYQSEICKQGSRAVEMYVVLRGECVAKHQTTDPFTKVEITINVGRFGPNSVMGCAEATAGRFNDIYTRQASIYAESPLLVLSRFDVFHLLSAEARASLQRCGQDEQLGSLDNRVMKTIVWEKYCKDFLAETLDNMPTSLKRISSPSKLSLEPLPQTMSLDNRALVDVGEIHVFQKHLSGSKSLNNLHDKSTRISTSNSTHRPSVIANQRRVSILTPTMTRVHKLSLKSLDTLSLDQFNGNQLALKSEHIDNASDSKPLTHFNPLSRDGLSTPDISKTLSNASKHFLWQPLHGVPHPYSLVGLAKPNVEGMTSIAFRVCGKFKDVEPTLRLFHIICTYDVSQPPTELDCSAFALYNEGEVAMLLRNLEFESANSIKPPQLRKRNSTKRILTDPRHDKIWKDMLGESHGLSLAIKKDGDPF